MGSIPIREFSNISLLYGFLSNPSKRPLPFQEECRVISFEGGQEIEKVWTRHGPIL